MIELVCAEISCGLYPRRLWAFIATTIVMMGPRSAMGDTHSCPSFLENHGGVVGLSVDVSKLSENSPIFSGETSAIPGPPDGPEIGLNTRLSFLPPVQPFSGTDLGDGFGWNNGREGVGRGTRFNVEIPRGRVLRGFFTTEACKPKSPQEDYAEGWWQPIIDKTGWPIFFHAGQFSPVMHAFAFVQGALGENYYLQTGIGLIVQLPGDMATGNFKIWRDGDARSFTPSTVFNLKDAIDGISSQPGLKSVELVKMGIRTLMLYDPEWHFAISPNVKITWSDVEGEKVVQTPIEVRHWASGMYFGLESSQENSREQALKIAIAAFGNPINDGAVVADKFSSHPDLQATSNEDLAQMVIASNGVGAYSFHPLYFNAETGRDAMPGAYIRLGLDGNSEKYLDPGNVKDGMYAIGWTPNVRLLVRNSGEDYLHEVDPGSAALVPKTSSDPIFNNMEFSQPMTAAEVRSLFFDGAWISSTNVLSPNQELYTGISVSNVWSAYLLKRDGANSWKVDARWIGFTSDKASIGRLKPNFTFSQVDGKPPEPLYDKIPEYYPTNDFLLPSAHPQEIKTTTKSLVDDNVLTASIPLYGVDGYMPSDLSIKAFDDDPSTLNIACTDEMVASGDQSYHNTVIGFHDGEDRNQVLYPIKFRCAKKIAYLLVNDFNSDEDMDSYRELGMSMARVWRDKGVYSELVDLSKWKLGTVYYQREAFVHLPPSEVAQRELLILLSGYPKTSRRPASDQLPMPLASISGLGVASMEDLTRTDRSLIENAAGPNIATFQSYEPGKTSDWDVKTSTLEVPWADEEYEIQHLAVSRPADLCFLTKGSNAVKCEATGFYRENQEEIDDLGIQIALTLPGFVPVYGQAYGVGMGLVETSRDVNNGEWGMATFDLATTAIDLPQVKSTIKAGAAVVRKASRRRKFFREIAKDLKLKNLRELELTRELIEQIRPGALKTKSFEEIVEEFKTVCENHCDDLIKARGPIPQAVIELWKRGKDYEAFVYDQLSNNTGKAAKVMETIVEKCGTPCDNLDPTDFLKQFRINLPGGEYMIADNVWVLKEAEEGVLSLVVNEIKLRGSTSLTSGQRLLKRSLQEIERFKLENPGKVIPDEMKLWATTENGLVEVEVALFSKIFGDGAEVASDLSTEPLWYPSWVFN